MRKPSAAGVRLVCKKVSKKVKTGFLRTPHHAYVLSGARVVQLELLNQLFNLRWNFHHEHDLLPDESKETRGEPDEEAAGKRKNAAIERIVETIKKVYFIDHITLLSVFAKNSTSGIVQHGIDARCIGRTGIEYSIEILSFFAVIEKEQSAMD
jgi:hypothetical protein